MAKWHKKAALFHDEVIREYSFAPDEAAVLAGAVDCLSNYWRASDLLSKEGLVTKAAGGLLRKHPGCEVAKNSWAGFLSGCRHLGICIPEREARRAYIKGGI